MDCSPPGSSVHGILQARTMEWVAISSSNSSSLVHDYYGERQRHRSPVFSTVRVTQPTFIKHLLCTSLCVYISLSNPFRFNQTGVYYHSIYSWANWGTESLKYFSQGHTSGKLRIKPRASDPSAAESLQSCPTLCNPIDGSPPDSPIPEILQARTLEWVAISFSNAWKWKVKMKSLSYVRLFATPWTAAYQAPPTMGFSRQEYWSGVPLPSLIWPLTTTFLLLAFAI